MLAYAALTALVAATGANAVINSVSGLRTCEPSLISWEPSTAPYYVTVIPGGQPSGATLKNLGTFQTETSYTWTVDLPAGTDITIQLKDGTGAILYTGETTITAGSSTSCVNNNVEVGGAAGSGSAAAATGASTAAGSVASASGAATSAAAAATTSAASAAGGVKSSAAAAAGSVTSKAAGAVSSAAGGASALAGSAKSAVASASSAVTGGSSAVVGLSSLAAFGAVAVGALVLA